MARIEFTDEQKDTLAELFNLALGAAGNSATSALKQTIRLIVPKVARADLADIHEVFKDRKQFTVTFKTGGFHRGGCMYVFEDELVENCVRAMGAGKTKEVALEDKMTFLRDLSAHIRESSESTFLTVIGKEPAFDAGEIGYVNFDLLALGNEYHEGMAQVQMKIVVGDHDGIFRVFVPLSFAQNLNQNFIQSVNVQIADFIPVAGNLNDEEKERLVNAVMYCKRVGDFSRVAEVTSTLRVVLAAKKLILKDLWELNPGDVIEFTKKTNDPADVIFGTRSIGIADVVTMGDTFGVKIKEVRR
jgi:flagellar motor switch protein FliN/FliY